MKIPLFEMLNKKIGIDLGTSRTKIWAGGSIVADQATCIAFDTKTQAVVAIGDSADEMSGRVAEHIAVVYPVVSGRIYDDKATITFLKILLSQAIGTTAFYNPVIMASIPALATQADKQITTNVLYALGAGEAYTIAQPLAASIGAGVPIADASGSFVLHLGAGLIEAVIISLGSSIVSASNEYGGNYFDESIQFFVKKHFSLHISKKTAAKIKKTIISLEPSSNKEHLFAGQDTSGEHPKEIRLTSKDMHTHALLYLEKVQACIVSLLSRTPPELAVDVIDKGLLLTGEGAQLHGIESFFVEKLGISVSVVDNCQTATIDGIGQALEHLDLFKKSLAYQN